MHRPNEIDQGERVDAEQCFGSQSAIELGFLVRRWPFVKAEDEELGSEPRMTAIAIALGDGFRQRTTMLERYRRRRGLAAAGSFVWSDV